MRKSAASRCSSGSWAPARTGASTRATAAATSAGPAVTAGRASRSGAGRTFCRRPKEAKSSFNTYMDAIARRSYPQPPDTIADAWEPPGSRPAAFPSLGGRSWPPILTGIAAAALAAGFSQSIEVARLRRQARMPYVWAPSGATRRPRHRVGGFQPPEEARFGRIAQLVEQLTLNQRVQGSSPCAPTIAESQFLLSGS